MKFHTLPAVALAALLGACGAPPSLPSADRRGVDVVVIYAENRSFVTFYGLFPGANGIPGLNPSAAGSVLPQRDVDGNVLPVLPPIRGGLAAPRQTQGVTRAQTSLANKPFQIDGQNGIDGRGVAVPITVTTRDLVHRFYNVAHGFAPMGDLSGALESHP